MQVSSNNASYVVPRGLIFHVGKLGNLLAKSMQTLLNEQHDVSSTLREARGVCREKHGPPLIKNTGLHVTSVAEIRPTAVSQM